MEKVFLALFNLKSCSISISNKILFNLWFQTDKIWFRFGRASNFCPKNTNIMVYDLVCITPHMENSRQVRTDIHLRFRLQSKVRSSPGALLTDLLSNTVFGRACLNIWRLVVEPNEILAAAALIPVGSMGTVVEICLIPKEVCIVFSILQLCTSTWGQIGSAE